MTKVDINEEFVTPNREIVNRRTGYVQKFGARRAFDGAYVGEVLTASGVTRDALEAALWVLAPLAENNCGDWTANDLLEMFKVVGFAEQKEKLAGKPPTKLTLVWNRDADDKQPE